MKSNQYEAEQMSQQMELMQKLQLLWDDPDKWPARLQELARNALKTKFTNTQAKALENACNGALSYSDVFQFIYGQVGKDNSAWVNKGWPDKLLKLLEEMRDEVVEVVGHGDSLEERLVRQRAVLMVYRKAGTYFAAYVAYWEKHKKSGNKEGKR